MHFVDVFNYIAGSSLNRIITSRHRLPDHCIAPRAYNECNQSRCPNVNNTFSQDAT